jgi:hypothetical protein
MVSVLRTCHRRAFTRVSWVLTSGIVETVALRALALTWRNQPLDQQRLGVLAWCVGRSHAANLRPEQGMSHIQSTCFIKSLLSFLRSIPAC